MRVIAYPNPTRNILSVFVDLKKPGFVSIEILDAMGKRMHQQNSYSGTGDRVLDFDLSAYPPGIYFLRVKGEDVNNVLKVAKF